MSLFLTSLYLRSLRGFSIHSIFYLGGMLCFLSASTLLNVLTKQLLRIFRVTLLSSLLTSKTLPKALPNSFPSSTLILSRKQIVLSVWNLQVITGIRYTSFLLRMDLSLKFSTPFKLLLSERLPFEKSRTIILTAF